MGSQRARRADKRAGEEYEGETGVRKRGKLTSKDKKKRDGGEDNMEEAKRSRGEDTMEDLGKMGMFEDTRDMRGWTKEEREFVQNMRVWGELVSITSQRRGTGEAAAEILRIRQCTENDSSTSWIHGE